jgi:hypothetical protein
MNEKFNNDFCIEVYFSDRKPKKNKTLKQLDLFEDFIELLDIKVKNNDKTDTKIIQDYKKIPIKNILK